MTDIIDRLAVRLFWKAEHLDPSQEGDVPESEWFSDTFPSTMDEHRRSFWRHLAAEAIATHKAALIEAGFVIVPREPSEAMENAVLDRDLDIYWSYRADGPGSPADVWRAMIDYLLAQNTLPSANAMASQPQWRYPGPSLTERP